MFRESVQSSPRIALRFCVFTNLRESRDCPRLPHRAIVLLVDNDLQC